MCKYYVLTIENTRFTQVSIIIYKKGGIMEKAFSLEEYLNKTLQTRHQRSLILRQLK